MAHISPHWKPPPEAKGPRKVLFRRGARTVPAQRALDRSLQALPRGALWRFCETAPEGPLYFLPTREWIAALAPRCRRLGSSILEVAAGDGLVAQALRARDPRIRVHATDSGRWESAAARMTAAERR